MTGAWLGILVIELVGAATFTLLCSEPTRWSLWGRLGLSFGLGLVVLTLSLFLASCGGLTPAWWLGASALAVLSGVAAVFRRTQGLAWLSPGPNQGQVTATRRERVVRIGLAVFLVSTCLIVGAVSLLEPLVEWDVLAIWAFKARVLLEEPVRSSQALRDVTRAYSHLDYPLLWPLAMSWVWACAGHADLQSVKVLAPALLASFAGLFYGLLRRRTDTTSALLFTAVLLGLPMLLSQTSRLMPDSVTAWFVVAAFGCCGLWLQSNHPDDLRIAGACAAGVLFTKNEGIGFFLVLVGMTLLLVLLKRTHPRRYRDLAWLVVIPVVATAPWFLLRVGIPKVHEDYGTRLTVTAIAQNLGRVPAILHNCLAYFGDVEDWLWFWPLLALALVAAAPRLIRPPLAFLAVSVALILAMDACVYVVSPWELDTLMVTTANRLLLQVAPLCVLLLAETAVVRRSPS